MLTLTQLLLVLGFQVIKLANVRCIVGLTTTPMRVQHIQPALVALLNQTQDNCEIVVSILLTNYLIYSLALTLTVPHPAHSLRSISHRLWAIRGPINGTARQAKLRPGS